LSEAFWSSFETDRSPFKDSDQALLKAIFNPHLCDRRAEGDQFAPPDASYSHVAKLRALVKEEEAVRQRRREAFCSKSFSMDRPGHVFPESWTSDFQLENGQTQMPVAEGRSMCALTERFEYQAQGTEMLKDALKTAVPIFDKFTEDGMCFRIYRLGSLEVRTFQEIQCEVVIGAVFSLQDPKSSASSRTCKVEEEEIITKATEYVERAVAGHRRYYVVLETEAGQQILTERHRDGRVSWEAYPENLEERNSLAKVTRSKACLAATSIRDLDMHAMSISQDGPVSPSACKRWARSTFWRIVGQAPK